jgi:hypothetical protein
VRVASVLHGADGTLRNPLYLHGAGGAYGFRDATRIFGYEQIEDEEEVVDFIAQSAT